MFPLLFGNKCSKLCHVMFPWQWWACMLLMRKLPSHALSHHYLRENQASQTHIHHQDPHEWSTVSLTALPSLRRTSSNRDQGTSGQKTFKAGKGKGQRKRLWGTGMIIWMREQSILSRIWLRGTASDKSRVPKERHAWMARTKGQKAQVCSLASRFQSNTPVP